jgi:hypothetical protein
MADNITPAQRAEIDAFRADLTPHQLAAIEDLAEITTKIMALNAFLETAREQGVPSDEATRMRTQLTHMSGYAIALADRVHNF